jgi:hypothetical protein
MQHGPAASSGSNPKAPGSAGGYLLTQLGHERSIFAAMHAAEARVRAINVELVGCTKTGGGREAKVAKIAKPTVETSVKVRLNLEKFVWSSREK